MSSDRRYDLSEVAKADMDDIYRYSFKTFGIAQTEAYLLGLSDKLTKLCLRPLTGRNRPEIRESLYSSPYKKHMIFYRIESERIIVVRVLHSSRDLIGRFD